MRAKQIYEFTRNSNPLRTLGIGKKLRDWEPTIDKVLNLLDIGFYKSDHMKFGFPMDLVTWEFNDNDLSDLSASIFLNNAEEENNELPGFYMRADHQRSGPYDDPLDLLKYFAFKKWPDINDSIANAKNKILYLEDMKLKLNNFENLLKGLIK